MNDMKEFVFKVVGMGFQGKKYHSVIISSNLIAEYKLGEALYNDENPFFAFTNWTYARDFANSVNKWPSAILLCKATTISRHPFVTSVVKRRYPGSYFAVPRVFDVFAGSVSQNNFILPPGGTVFCSAIMPLEVLDRNCSKSHIQKRIAHYLKMEENSEY